MHGTTIKIIFIFAIIPRVPEPVSTVDLVTLSTVSTTEQRDFDLLWSGDICLRHDQTCCGFGPASYALYLRAAGACGNHSPSVMPKLYLGRKIRVDGVVSYKTAVFTATAMRMSNLANSLIISYHPRGFVVGLLFLLLLSAVNTDACSTSYQMLHCSRYIS